MMCLDDEHSFPKLAFPCLIKLQNSTKALNILMGLMANIANNAERMRAEDWNVLVGGCEI